MNFQYEIENKNLLVVGDVMLDTYCLGEVNRISPEAPIPVFKKKSERCVLGGAANVATNLVAAGQNVSVMAIIGDDKTGERLKILLEEEHINTDLVVSLDRHTTEKTRFLASNNQQVLRLDVEDVEQIDETSCNMLKDRLRKIIGSFDLILISDYHKGLLTYDLTQSLIREAREHNIPVIVDVKDQKTEKYAGATLLKPNLKELAYLTGLAVDTDDEIVAASEQLRSRCNCKYVLTTCGARGMVLVGDGMPFFLDAIEQEVFDVTGAGDTTIAYLGACMANHFSMRDAVETANLAAGIQVSKVGTSTVYWREIRERVSDQREGFARKLMDEGMIDAFRNEHKNQKIVFTNGCFDILHIGHLRYLQEAAKLGDILVIGLNSDDSVRRLKGKERPINNEMDRAEMLGMLGFVDYIAVFDEDTPLELIKRIQPDVLVKGGDYKPEEVVGWKEVEGWDGSLVLFPFVEGRSSTSIIEKIRQ